MRVRRFLALILLTGTISVVTLGCGDASQGVKVTGSVTSNGKPEEGATVSFIPTDPKLCSPGGGRTSADGKFETKLKPGSYTVVLTKLVDKSGKVPKESDNPEEDFTQLEASGRLKQVYPQKYVNPSTSPIKVEIPPGGKNLDPFDVATTGGKK